MPLPVCNSGVYASPCVYPWVCTPHCCYSLGVYLSLLLMSEKRASCLPGAKRASCLPGAKSATPFSPLRRVLPRSPSAKRACPPWCEESLPALVRRVFPDVHNCEQECSPMCTTVSNSVPAMGPQRG